MLPPPAGGPDAASADRRGGGAGPDTALPPAGIDGILIDGIADWLISSALGRTGVDSIFEGCCQRLHAAGVPLVRALTAFRTLHPLVRVGQSRVEARSGGRPQPDTARAGVLDRGVAPKPDAPPSPPPDPVSPAAAHRSARHRGLSRDRRAARHRHHRLPLLPDAVRERGWARRQCPRHRGILGDGSAKRLQRGGSANLRAGPASLCSLLQGPEPGSNTRNVLETHLGPDAGARVPDGRIRRGDGERIHAVIWYSDRRDLPTVSIPTRSSSSSTGTSSAPPARSSRAAARSSGSWAMRCSRSSRPGTAAATRAPRPNAPWPPRATWSAGSPGRTAASPRWGQDPSGSASALREPA